MHAKQACTAGFRPAAPDFATHYSKLQDVRLQLLLQVTASQKRMQNKYSLAASTADDWYRRAELALNKGDEELAKEALSRRKAFQVGLGQAVQHATPSMPHNDRGS